MKRSKKILSWLLAAAIIIPTGCKTEDDVINFLLNQVEYLVELSRDITVCRKDDGFPSIRFTAVFNMLDECGIPRPTGGGCSEADSDRFISICCEDGRKQADHDDQQYTNEGLFHVQNLPCCPEKRESVYFDRPRAKAATRSALSAAPADVSSRARTYILILGSVPEGRTTSAEPSIRSK